MSNRLKTLVKRQLGHALSWLRPDIAERIESELKTERRPGEPDSLIERLVLASVISRHTADPDSVVRLHKSYWSGERALAFHGGAEQRLERNTFGMHGELFDELERVLACGRYHRLCEIGCGAGVLTNRLAQRFPQLSEVIGLDLSPKQTEINNTRFANSRLRFVAADATAWVPEDAKAGTVYLTYDGVLQYLSQHELKALLRSCSAHAPICFAVMEPIAFDYDLEAEVESRLFDAEMALSHNYLRAFEAEGFSIHWWKELPRGRYLMMIAFTESDRDAA